MDVNVTIKIEIGESVKNLFAEMFKLVGNKPSLVVSEKEDLPVVTEATLGNLKPETQAEEAVKEEPKAATKTRTRSASTSKKVEAPAPEPEPENIPEIPEDEAELTGDESPAGDPVDENGEPLTPQKIQVIAMRKGLPAFKAALAEVTKGTVKTLQTLHGADMQGVYNYLLKLEDAKGK
jgi:hypothetical protein